VPSKAALKPDLIALILALGFVVAARILLYVWMPERSSDFDLLYRPASRLLQGESLYPSGGQFFPYPLPAVLLAIPFTLIPLTLARPIFDILIGGAFVYGLWKHRGPYAVLAVISGAYLFALFAGQTTPLMVAASLIPALGFLLAVKPNTSASLWISRPNWLAVLGATLFVGVSFLLVPTWPRDWWVALPADKTLLAPPILRPFGFVLLIAGLRWRLPESRLILATAFIPQTTLPYELVSLALIPANRLEMVVYVAGTWVALGAAQHLGVGRGLEGWTATGWPVTLCAVYVPMLYLVVRRPTGRTVLKLAKERRRPNRLPDEELTVDVTPSKDGVTVTVTHTPSQLFATEAGPTRKQAERRAQDRLAAMVAEARRAASAA
jgi:hypothetical protein